MTRLLEPNRQRRQKYEFCVVLCVRARTDGLLSRFIADDKRMEEGKGKAEEVLKLMRDAGLKVKVKKHSPKDGSRLLMVFATAELGRLEQQHARLQRERWLQEEGIGDTIGDTNFTARVGQQPKPSARVVRVGGLHYFAGDGPGASDGAAGAGLHPIRPAAAGSGSGSGSSDLPPVEEAPASGFRPSAAHRVELLNHILRTPAEQGGAGLEALQKADKRGTILHIFPLQDAHANRALRRRAKRVNPFFGPSLEGFLRDVRWQYGEKVAFYYAFNAHYTAWLVVPAAVGGFLFGLSFFAAQQVQQFSPFFAAFMAIWGAAFCKAWKRRANRLALEWNTLNRRESEVVRTAFFGYPRTSPVTGELEAAYPQWRRLLKYMVTVVVIGMQVLSMCAWVAVLYFGYFYIQSTEWGDLYTPFLLNGLNSTVWGISLEFLNFIIFYKIAILLNAFENHRTVQVHENRLIAKIFTFYFIDCFLWFFLLAFFQIPFGVQIDALMNTTTTITIDKPFEKEIWMSRLGQTIGAVLSLTQWSMVFFADAYVPHKLRSRLLRRRASKRQQPQRAQVGPTPALALSPEPPSLEMPPIAPSPTTTAPLSSLGGRRARAAAASAQGGGGGGGSSTRAAKPADDPHERMSELLDQASMPPYDPILDYCGIVIQFGYVTFFSVVWQLAPLVCMLHTMFRRNSNLLRLDKLSMRPLPEPSSGIGLWDLLMKFTASLAVLINCMIVSVSTDQLDYVSCYSQSLFRDDECRHGNVPMTSRFLIAAVAGYVILAIVFLIDNTLPDQQEEVNIRLKKAAYLFKRRYMESMAAERAMSGDMAAVSGHLGPGAVSNLRVMGGGAYRAINYDSDWGSGSDVSDAFEEVEVSGTRTASINLGFAQ